uniref:Uncharacterized protein n=1 Tax=Rhizophagus irregularis (strain DAOM 181602 / DAOM 197198 / MUCL 43194) TaxID=747089 RepID=U9T901_RHIID
MSDSLLLCSLERSAVVVMFEDDPKTIWVQSVGNEGTNVCELKEFSSFSFSSSSSGSSSELLVLLSVNCGTNEELALLFPDEQENPKNLDPSSEHNEVSPVEEFHTPGYSPTFILGGSWTLMNPG